MTNPQSQNESVVLDGQSLGKLEFHWREDRFCHQWKFQDSDFELQSIESCSEQLWPESPPLQQIHSQSFDDGREIIFGVGMSGRGHWSASFTLVPELKCWIVELACKTPVVPEKLCSNYAVNQDLQALEAGKLGLPGSGVTLEAIAPSSSVAYDERELCFAPCAIAGAESTSQWAFRLRVDSAS